MKKCAIEGCPNDALDPKSGQMFCFEHSPLSIFPKSKESESVNSESEKEMEVQKDYDKVFAHQESSAEEENLVEKEKNNNAETEIKEGKKEEETNSVSSAKAETNNINVINTLDPVLEIHHIDVGQGESTLIRYIETKKDKEECINILIDGGDATRGGDTIVRYLGMYGIQTLDIVVCSHFDIDHFLGLKRLLALGFTFKKFIHPIEDKDEKGKYKTDNNSANEFVGQLYKKKVEMENPKIGGFLNFGKSIDLKMKCLWYYKDLGGKENNDCSIAWLLSFGKFKYYTAGDLQSAYEDDLSGKILDGDTHLCAFKCGHHGSHHSTSKPFVDAVKPEVAFISCGKHGHAHPRPQAIKNLVDSKNKKNSQRIYLTNCFHDRRYVNPGYAGEDRQGTDIIKGRVAGDNEHLGVIVLRATLSQANKHVFGVGYWNDGTWGETKGWQWFKHKCESGEPTIGMKNFPNYENHVKLSNLNSIDMQKKFMPRENWNWFLAIFTHRQYIEPTKEIMDELRSKKQNLYKRFGVPDPAKGISTQTEWSPYASASDMLWKSLKDQADELFNTWVDENDRKLKNEDELKKKTEELEKSLLSFIELKSFKELIDKAKYHPEGSEEHSVSGRDIEGEAREIFADEVAASLLENKDKYEFYYNEYVTSIVKKAPRDVGFEQSKKIKKNMEDDEY